MDVDVGALLRALEPKAPSYDPACERFEVAIKAIWLLFRRGRWALLEGLGLERRLYESLFTEFDLRVIISDHGRLHQDAHVVQLLKMEWKVLGRMGILAAALEMVHVYQKKTARARGAYYAARREAA